MDCNRNKYRQKKITFPTMPTKLLARQILDLIFQLYINIQKGFISDILRILIKYKLTDHFIQLCKKWYNRLPYVNGEKKHI